MSNYESYVAYALITLIIAVCVYQVWMGYQEEKQTGKVSRARAVFLQVLLVIAVLINLIAAYNLVIRRLWPLS